ncbi:MAG: hypothetical protein WDW36_000439 [Sanguina aurantia]
MPSRSADSHLRIAPPRAGAAASRAPARGHRSQDRRCAAATAVLPLGRLKALLEIAHSMISVDTGPAHLAAAMGCPLVVLFGERALPSMPAARRARAPRQRAAARAMIVPAAPIE